MNRHETICYLKALVAVADYYRYSFYMTPPSSAAGRRYEEKRATVPEFTWIEGGHKYTACYKVTCSCTYVYARGYYTRDGKKTNLTAVKNSLKRLEQEQEEREKCLMIISKLNAEMKHEAEKDARYFSEQEEKENV